jgi:hypothetical protein
VDILNDFSRSARLEPALATRLRRYLRSQHREDAAAPGVELHSVLDGMPPPLRHEVALSTNAHIYARLPLCVEPMLPFKTHACDAMSLCSLSAAPLLLLIELSFAFKPMLFPPGEELCRAGEDASHGFIMTLRRGLVCVLDPTRDIDAHPFGRFVSPALAPGAAAELLIGEEALWAAVFPAGAGMGLRGATVRSITTASCMALRAADLAPLLRQFPEYLQLVRVPVRARWLRRSLRVVAAGVRRVRQLLSVTRRLRKPDSAIGLGELLAAAAGAAGVGRRGPTERLRRRTPLALDDADELAPAAQPMSMPLAVFIVSVAAPERFRALRAAALTIQRIFRGERVRQQVRARIARARHSTRAMQRLSSKLAGREPSVAALELLRAVQIQLRVAMEQVEQAVAESMERSAVTRERMRISQLGLARASGSGGGQAALEAVVATVERVNAPAGGSRGTG